MNKPRNQTMNIHPKDTKEGKVYQIVKWSMREDWAYRLLQRRGDELISVGKSYGILDWGNFKVTRDFKPKSKQFQLKEIKDSEVMKMGFTFYPGLGWRTEKYPFKLKLICICDGEEFFSGEEGYNDEFGNDYIKTDDLESIDLSRIRGDQNLLYYGSAKALIDFLSYGTPSWLVLPENIAVSYSLTSFLKDYPKVRRVS